VRVPNVPAADRFLFVYPKAGAPKPSRVFHLHGESRHAASPTNVLPSTEISRWNVLRSVTRLRRPTSMSCLPVISVIGEGGGGGVSFPSLLSGKAGAVGAAGVSVLVP
jgi:hypothetical protein